VSESPQRNSAKKCEEERQGVVMADVGSFIGVRIRAARKRLDISQDELAVRAGFEHRQSVSQIENGSREVKAAELVRLSRALHVSITELLDAHEPRVPRVCWREEPAAGGKEYEARLLSFCRAYHSARKALEESEPRRLPNPDLNVATAQYRDVDKLALDVAGLLKLGARPASSLADTLENQYDLLIWFAPLRSGGSAACTRGEHGDAILINSDEPPWRRNFDLAHELFHLLTWDTSWGDDQQKRVEPLANRFAASLLLPADELQSARAERCRAGEVDYADLVSIARDFGTSTEALLWRMCNLHWIKREDVDSALGNDGLRRLDKAARRGEWQDPPPLPDRFVRTVFFAYAKGLMSRARLAECLETSLVDLDDRLAQFGIEDGDYHQRIACAG
jgi:Zn-dependent peptidase ImmA (M78 family)/transcriptional regulator with XRE-family HTH domain